MSVFVQCNGHDVDQRLPDEDDIPIIPSISRTVLLSDISVPPLQSEKKCFVTELLACGYGLVHLDDLQWDSAETSSTSLQPPIAQWERLFTDLFALPEESLQRAGIYRSIQHVSAGYRREGQRQFLECRMTDRNIPYPDYSEEITGYSTLIQSLYDVHCPIAERVLELIAVDGLALDAQVLTDLTDVSVKGRAVSPSSSTTASASVVSSSVEEVGTLSSSLLRICRYGNDPLAHAFGAHTDISFLTLGLVSSTPGLEMLDNRTDEWVPVEKHAPKNSLLIFVGELLQVLTKQRIRACVHRVRRSEGHSSTDGFRVSCPLLVRERPNAIMAFRSERYDHPGGTDAVSEDKIADFDGIAMKLIHQLLERKRKKCFEMNCGVKEEWILSAFPVDTKQIQSSN